MKTFKQLLEEAKKHTDFWVQGTILDFTEEVVRRMDEEGITRTQLADKILVKPAYITKILGGTNNFTLETMVKIARALNSRVRVHLQREDCQSEWMEFLKNEPLLKVETPAEVWLHNEAFIVTNKSPEPLNERTCSYPLPIAA